MNVKQASLVDAGTLARLNQHVHDLHLKNVPTFFRSPSREEATLAFHELLTRDNVRAFIAYADDQAVGYILIMLNQRPTNAFSMERRWLYLDQISVEPNWQGQGVGRALVNAMLDHAKELDIVEIEVETWMFNESAQAFFKSCGFQPKTIRAWMSAQE